MGKTDGKKLVIARRLYLFELTGKPTEHLRATYPLIARKLDTYLMCRALGTLPRAGGLDNQWQEDLDYFKVFMAVESEVRHRG